MEPPNDTSLTIVSYLQAELCMLLVDIPETATMMDTYIGLVYAGLGFMVERLPLPMWF